MKRLFFAAGVLVIFAGGYFVGFSRQAPPKQETRSTLNNPAYTWSYSDPQDGWTVWLALETETEAQGFAEHCGGGYNRERN